MATGCPIAAFAGRREVMSTLEPGSVAHGGTYTGNLVGVAAALTTLEILEKEPVLGPSRMPAVAKSPLAGAVGDSQCGGFFPAEMKFAGFDAVVLRGKADEPLYLWIREGTPELRPAAHLWGKITGEVEDILRAELGDDKLEVLQTGPPGERGVRFAALMNMANRANGRARVGGVMGSKNLKAVVVRG